MSLPPEHDPWQRQQRAAMWGVATGIALPLVMLLVLLIAEMVRP